MSKVLPATISAVLVIAGLIATLLVIGLGIEITVGAIIGAVAFVAVASTILIAA